MKSQPRAIPPVAAAVFLAAGLSLAACTLPAPTLVADLPEDVQLIGTPIGDLVARPPIDVEVEFLGTRPCGVIGGDEKESAYIKITNNGDVPVHDAAVRIRTPDRPAANWPNIMFGTNNGEPDGIYTALCERPWGGDVALVNGNSGYTAGNLFTPVQGQEYIVYWIVCGEFGFPGQCATGQFELTYLVLDDVIVTLPDPPPCYTGPGEFYPQSIQIQPNASFVLLARDLSSEWLFLRLIESAEFCWFPLAELPPLPQIDLSILRVFDPSVYFIGTPFVISSLPTSTPTAGGGCTYTALVNLFCRIGPSYGPELDTFVPGAMAEVVGISPDGSHSYVIGPNNGRICAVPNGEPWGQLTGNCSSLPQFTPFPTSTNTQPPPRPTDTATPTPCSLSTDLC